MATETQSRDITTMYSLDRLPRGEKELKELIVALEKKQSGSEWKGKSDWDLLVKARMFYDEVKVDRTKPVITDKAEAFIQSLDFDDLKKLRNEMMVLQNQGKLDTRFQKSNPDWTPRDQGILLQKIQERIQKLTQEGGFRA